MMRNEILGRLAKPRLWRMVLIGFWLALVVSTHVPRDFPGLPADGVDKLAHVVAYAVLAGLVALNLELAGGHVTRRHLLWLWMAVVLLGAVDELTQPVFNRDAGWTDWLGDAIGAAVGLIVFALARRWALRRRRSD